MTATRQDLFLLLDRLEIAHSTVEHPPVFTVAESTGVTDAMPGGHTKNLFLKDKTGQLHLLCAIAETKIDLNRLAKTLGVGRFSFAGPELMHDALGVTPGSVTVFAAINDKLNRVEILLDEALFAHAIVNFHPLTNDATTAVAPKALLKFLTETGHRPRRILFAPDGAPSLVE
jgi:Ala-tRNA(Pro) deacylase